MGAAAPPGPMAVSSHSRSGRALYGHRRLVLCLPSCCPASPGRDGAEHGAEHGSSAEYKERHHPKTGSEAGPGGCQRIPARVTLRGRWPQYPTVRRLVPSPALSRGAEQPSNRRAMGRRSRVPRHPPRRDGAAPRTPRLPTPGLDGGWRTRWLQTVALGRHGPPPPPPPPGCSPAKAADPAPHLSPPRSVTGVSPRGRRCCPGCGGAGDTHMSQERRGTTRGARAGLARCIPFVPLPWTGSKRGVRAGSWQRPPRLSPWKRGSHVISAGNHGRASSNGGCMAGSTSLPPRGDGRRRRRHRHHRHHRHRHRLAGVIGPACRGMAVPWGSANPTES